MAGASYNLRRLQVGAEATRGTTVPATWIIPGQFIYTPMRERYFTAYPRGLRVRQTGGGQILYQGATVTGKSDNTPQDLLYPLALGFGAGTPTTALGATTWVFTVNTTQDPNPKSATAEFVATDGTTNFFASKSGYMLCDKFTITSAFNQPETMDMSLFGQAETSGITPTAALTLLTGRETLSGANRSYSIDTTWAGLGGTQLTGTVRSMKLDVATGLAPDYTQDGRSTQDMSGYMFGEVKHHLQLVVENNATTATQLSTWRAGSLVFVRTKNVSPTIVGSGSAHLTQQTDMAMVFTKDPVLSNSGAMELVTLELDLDYDPVSAKSAVWTLINGIASFT